MLLHILLWLLPIVGLDSHRYSISVLIKKCWRPGKSPDRLNYKYIINQSNLFLIVPPFPISQNNLRRDAKSTPPLAI